MTWPHTVTLWSRGEDETYTRCIIGGCLWQDKRGVQLRKTGTTSDNGVVVFLPAGAEAKPKDRIIKGEVVADVCTGKDLDKLGALFITAADTFDYGLAHVEVTCK